MGSVTTQSFSANTEAAAASHAGLPAGAFRGLCHRCKDPDAELMLDKRSKSGSGAWCLRCKREYNRSYYLRNRRREIRRRIEAQRLALWRTTSSRQCTEMPVQGPHQAGGYYVNTGDFIPHSSHIAISADTVARRQDRERSV